MKILFISNHFSLPYQPGAPRPWKVAQYFRSLGHSVTVITNRRHYLDEDIKVGGMGNGSPFVVDGVKIVGVETTSGRRKSLIGRFVNYFSFSYMAYLVGKETQGPDVIIVGTPPLIVPLTGILLGRRHNAFTILEIRDLFPETAVALGKVRNKIIQFFWEQWENALRRRYDHIVAVVPGIQKLLLEKGFPPKKMTTITNGFDTEHNRRCALPAELEEFFQKQAGKFIVVYGGGMGHAINLLTVLQAAELCCDEESLVFAFFGEGELKPVYIQYAQARGLENCYFFPVQSRCVISEVFRRADALVHSFNNTDFFMCALPNKIFEYHGAGQPIVFAGKGDTAHLIKMAGSGLVVEPENPVQMADAFRFLAANPEKAQAMGRTGRAYIMKCYRREVVFQAWARLLEKVAN